MLRRFQKCSKTGGPDGQLCSADTVRFCLLLTVFLLLNVFLYNFINTYKFACFIEPLLAYEWLENVSLLQEGYGPGGPGVNKSNGGGAVAAVQRFYDEGFMV